MIGRFWRLRKGVLLAGVFAAALLPRLLALGRYVTPDELIWVFRVVQFDQAFWAQRWADTLVSGHPGMTTIWLGLLGMRGQMLVYPADRAVYDWLTHLAFFMPDNVAAFSQLAVFLTGMRLAVAVVNSLGVTAVFLLSRSLFNSRTAGLIALLLAFDPFVAGLSGLLHVDALMTTFATLSLLALIGAIRPQFAFRRRLKYAAWSGLMAAGAVLTKTPALLLVPLAGLFFFLSLFVKKDGRSPDGRFPFKLSRAWPQTIAAGLIWLIIFVIAIFAFYPALWSVPGQVFSLLSGNANRHIGSALRPSFFLGEVAYEHGALFYPVVLAFRLSPVVFAGLLAMVYLWLRRSGRAAWPILPTALLLAWSVLFIAGITFAAKKFDRYALAVIPALTILAALAWSQLAERWPRWGRYAAPILVGIQAVYYLFFIPHPLAAYNPLVGGPRAAAKALPIGWGEAVSAAGQWLAAQPGAEGKTAVSGLPPSFVPFFPGQTLLPSPENQRQADYVILTANGRQINPDQWPNLPDNFTLLHTIHYGGLDQAWIFAQPNPQKTDLPLADLAETVSFGNRVALTAAGTAVTGDQLYFYARWQVEEGGEDGRYVLKLTLRDETGIEWAGREAALVNETYFYPQDWPPGPTAPIRYALDLPPGLPPGQYALDISLFDADEAQMPVLVGGAFRGVVHTETVAVPALVGGALTIPVRADTTWLDGALTLLGYAPPPAQLTTGETAVLDLYWQADKPLPDGVTVGIGLGDGETAVYPLSRHDSGRWQPGDQVHEKIKLAIPPALPGGEYAISLRVANEAPLPLGTITVTATDRLFALPDDIPYPLDIAFGDLFALRGMTSPTGKAGETAVLTLYWQIIRQPDALYTVFVHVIDDTGSIVSQSDRWPGGLPTDTRAGGEIIIDEIPLPLPADLPPGAYEIRVGVYMTDTGLRLPVTRGAAGFDDLRPLPASLLVIDQ